MSYDEAMRLASRDEAFKATVYAMNTLLIHRGIYTKDEFEQLVVEWVKKEESKKTREHSLNRHQGISA
jgi:molybdopterin synthase catalytic subunit